MEPVVPDPEAGEQLRKLFAKLSEEGWLGPMLQAYIDGLQAEGALGEEAARALRDNDRDAIEAHLRAAAGKPEGFWDWIVWPF